MMDATLPGVSRYLTIDEMLQGYAEIEGLTKNTLYTVNVYDTNKPRKYDKPYNSITLRTAGPSASSIPVGPEDDLSAMLLENDLNRRFQKERNITCLPVLPTVLLRSNLPKVSVW